MRAVVADIHAHRQGGYVRGVGAGRTHRGVHPGLALMVLFGTGHVDPTECLGRSFHAIVRAHNEACYVAQSAAGAERARRQVGRGAPGPAGPAGGSAGDARVHHCTQTTKD